MSSQETVVPLSVPLALFFCCLTLYMGILVFLRSRKDLTELAGTIGFSKGFDHKKLRKTRNDIG